ncbi:MAG: hypothetical protein EBS01_05970 [Verrucomicrobia bacterium]|nr:hypothetical protein [Verrucomicrobiota bacterium]
MALQVATTFYVNGFKLALSALGKERQDESTEGSMESPLSLEGTLKELLISLAFWGLAFFSIGLAPAAITCGVTFIVVIVAQGFLPNQFRGKNLKHTRED